MSDFVNIPKTCKERILVIDPEYTRPLMNKDLLMAGLSHLKSGYEIRRPRYNHRHRLNFTISGEANYLTNYSKGKLKAGDMWLMPSHEPHYFWVDCEWNNMWFQFDDSSQWTFLRNQPIQIYASTCLEPLYQAMNNLLIESLNKTPESSKLSLLYSEIICQLIDRELNIRKSPKEQRIQHLLNSLWQKIEQNLNTVWTLTKMAKHLNISTIQLYRYCISCENKKPMEKVTDLRMNRTAMYLTQTDYTLKQIAGQVGYQSAFSLSKAFKRHYKLSPKMFRQKSLTKECS